MASVQTCTLKNTRVQLSGGASKWLDLKHISHDPDYFLLSGKQIRAGNRPHYKIRCWRV